MLVGVSILSLLHSFSVVFGAHFYRIKTRRSMSHLEKKTKSQFALQTTTIKYTLDGKPTENPKPLEPGTMQVSATFDDGVFTTRLVMEGKPEMVVVRKIVNGEIEQTKSCGGASFTDYEARG